MEDAIAYVKSYGYIDDERYVRNYIEYRREQKSRRQLEQELQYRKGVPQELIQKVYEDLEPADEKPLIRRFLEKKGYRPEITDEKTRRKLIAALLRKGFRMGDVLAVLRETGRLAVNHSCSEQVAQKTHRALDTIVKTV